MFDEFRSQTTSPPSDGISFCPKRIIGIFFPLPALLFKPLKEKKNIFTLQPMEFNIGSSILLEGLILFV